MKKLILTVIILCCTLSSWAFDYNYLYSNNVIYFNDLLALRPEVEVTYKSTKYNSYSYDVVIPSSIYENYRTYSVVSIGANAFSYCTRLTSVTIPSSITTIGTKAFYFFAGSSINIPSSVTVIGEKAFAGGELTSITIPSSVDSIATGAFSNCDSLKAINFNAIHCNFMGGGNFIFENDFALKTLNIGDSVKVIPKFAFYGAIALKTINISSSVDSIGDAAFGDCLSLTSIFVYRKKPIHFDSSISTDPSYKDPFSSIDKTKCTLHVPIGSKGLYVTANVWKDFNIVEDLPSDVFNAKASNAKINIENGLVVITDTQSGLSLTVYNLQGAVIYQGKTVSDTITIPLPARGVYVVRIGNKSVKVIY